MTDLSELLERVKAATGPSIVLDGELYATIGGAPPTWTRRALPLMRMGEPNYTGSVDAALALMERVLSGRDDGPLLYARIGFWNAEAINGRNFLQTFHVAVGTTPVMVTVETDGATEPLAIIAATLTALIARKDAQ